MAIMITRRRLPPNDFDDWRIRFEADAENRRKAGCRGIQRFRNIDDPDELIVIFDWDSRESAENFAKSKLSSRPGVAVAKRDDGTPAFVNDFYEQLPPLKS
jgi:heme-degrading monooxygenase HmoA